MSDYDEEVLRIIDEYGWHITQVRNAVGEEEGPTFSYSTGLWDKFRHPELIIFGLKSEVEAALINIAGNAIKDEDKCFEADRYYEDFLEGYEVFMLEADERGPADYATWTNWYYGRRPFPLVSERYEH